MSDVLTLLTPIISSEAILNATKLNRDLAQQMLLDKAASYGILPGSTGVSQKLFSDFTGDAGWSTQDTRLYKARTAYAEMLRKLNPLMSADDITALVNNMSGANFGNGDGRISLGELRRLRKSTGLSRADLRTATAENYGAEFLGTTDEAKNYTKWSDAYNQLITPVELPSTPEIKQESENTVVPKQIQLNHSLNFGDAHADFLNSGYGKDFNTLWGGLTDELKGVFDSNGDGLDWNEFTSMITGGGSDKGLFGRLSFDLMQKTLSELGLGLTDALLQSFKGINRYLPKTLVLKLDIVYSPPPKNIEQPEVPSVELPPVTAIKTSEPTSAGKSVTSILPAKYENLFKAYGAGGYGSSHVGMTSGMHNGQVVYMLDDETGLKFYPDGTVTDSRGNKVGSYTHTTGSARGIGTERGKFRFTGSYGGYKWSGANLSSLKDSVIKANENTSKKLKAGAAYNARIKAGWTPVTQADLNAIPYSPLKESSRRARYAREHGWELDPIAGRYFKKYLKGGLLNKYQQGNKMEQDIQIVATVIKMMMQLLNQLISDLDAIAKAQLLKQELPDVFNQVLQEGSQMMQQQAQMKRKGGQLNYLRTLRNQCPEGYETEYFKAGGAICSKCRKKAEMQKGGEVELPKNAVEAFKAALGGPVKPQTKKQSTKQNSQPIPKKQPVNKLQLPSNSMHTTKKGNKEFNNAISRNYRESVKKGIIKDGEPLDRCGGKLKKKHLLGGILTFNY